jgi:hypothetical protein
MRLGGPEAALGVLGDPIGNRHPRFRDLGIGHHRAGGEKDGCRFIIGIIYGIR